jgi:hypothetical protein
MKSTPVLLLTCITLISGLGLAEETPVIPKANPAEMPHHEKLNQRLAEDSDSTINTSNIKLNDSYAEKRDDEWKNTATLNFNYAFGHSKNGSWGLKFGVPFESIETAKKGQKDGFGDLTLKLNRSFNATKKLRLGLGVQNTFNTANEDILGGQADVLEWIGSSSYHINKTIRAQLSLKYSGSIYTESDQGYTSTSTITPALAFRLPYHTLCIASYLGKFNYKTSDYNKDLKFQLSHLLGKKKKWNGSVYYKVPLQTEKTKYTLNAALTYHL